MKGAQLFLIGIFCAVSVRKFAEAQKVEQGIRDSRNDLEYRERVKRYVTGRVPLSYLYNGVDEEDNYPVDKRYRSNSIRNNPAASHFRELQIRQVKRPSPFVDLDGRSMPSQMQSYRDLQYPGINGNDEGGDIDVDLSGFGESPVIPHVSEAGSIGSQLSDDELQTLLVLLEEYRLQGKPGSQGKSHQNFYTPPAQYFTPEMEVAGTSMGKRETGKRMSNRGPLVLEQPMSFENSLGGDSFPVFLNQKRSKRVGSPALKKKIASSTRIKKETDPAVEADLDKIFAGAKSTNQQAVSHSSHQSTSIPTTAIATNQIPPPSSSQKKPKKSIDWSEHFGIDKRQDNHKQTSSNIEPSPNNKGTENEQVAVMRNVQTTYQESDPAADKNTSPSANEVSHVHGSEKGTQGKNEKMKKDETKNTWGNDTDEKADRKWILKEFYKNLAMSNKRKRESPATVSQNKLDKLEKIERKMEEAGDKIIWDALKYTGAHKGAELSPEELAQVKNEIIQKLAAAYSLEKVREAIEEFRQQLGQLKDKQQY